MFPSHFRFLDPLPIFTFWFQVPLTLPFDSGLGSIFPRPFRLPLFAPHFRFPWATSSLTIHFRFSRVTSGVSLQTTAVRIHMTAENATEDFPVLVVVRQQRHILSWQMPLILETV